MEDMAKTPFVEKRGAVWWFRRKIEKDLISHYAPKTEFRFSLKTKDRKEAEAKARIESVRIDQEFARVRAELKQEPKRTITDIAEIEGLAESYYGQRLYWDEESRLKGLSVEQFEEMERNVEEALGEFRQGMIRNDPTEVLPEIEEFLVVYPEVKVARGTETYQRLVRAIYRANVRSLELIKRRNQGEIIDTPRPPATVGGLTLSGAYERWKREHRGPKKTPVTFLSHVDRFISLHGDLPVSAITKAHVREFKDALMDYPARPPNEVRKLPMAQVIEMYKSKPDVPRLKPQSINEGALAALRAVLQHAVSEGFIDHNPALGVSVKLDKNAEPSRLPYSDEDIARIIAFPIFRGERPEAGGGAAAVWLPLLAMYSGARLEELAALTKENFGTEEGVLYFRIQGRTKNKGSKRKVPIHSKLIELGFMRYVEGITSGPIFPKLEGTNEKTSHSWSKWWGRYCRAQGDYRQEESLPLVPTHREAQGA